MVNDNIFTVMSEKTIKIYSRPQLRYVPPIVPIVSGSVQSLSKAGKKKWMSKKDKLLLATAEGSEAESKSEQASLNSLTMQKFNFFTLSGRLNIHEGITAAAAFGVRCKRPTLMRLAAKDKLLIGFDDGSVRILFCPALLDPEVVAAASKATAVAGTAASGDKNAKAAGAGPIHMEITLGEAHNSDDKSHNQSKDSAQQPAAGTMAAVLCDFQAHFVPAGVLNSDGAVDGDDEVAATAAEEKATAKEMALAASSTLEGSFADDISENSELLPPTKAKHTKNSTRGVRSAIVCPWANCSGGSGLGYQLELLTVGCDRRLVHWGVRFKPGQEDVVLMPHYSNTTRAGTAADIGGEQSEFGSLQDDSFQGGGGDGASNAAVDALPMESDILGVSWSVCLFGIVCIICSNFLLTCPFS